MGVAGEAGTDTTGETVGASGDSNPWNPGRIGGESLSFGLGLLVEMWSTVISSAGDRRGFGEEGSWVDRGS